VGQAALLQDLQGSWAAAAFATLGLRFSLGTKAGPTKTHRHTPTHPARQLSHAKKPIPTTHTRKQVAPGKPSQLRQRFPRVNLGAGPMLSDSGFDLLSRLLTLNPARRLSAKEALDHDWFREGPLPAQQNIMPTFPSRATRD
jgi:serine/threonine protein kinase